MSDEWSWSIAEITAHPYEALLYIRKLEKELETLRREHVWILKSEDCITVNGNVVYTFAGIQGLDPRTLKGRRVEIDGYLFDVLGVETYAIVDATGTNFGLAVMQPTGINREALMGGKDSDHD